ncbi:MAG: DUF2914 domain-containing protein [bacterium]|nr:DUF2914 domain-containing protein [bacterium]
MISRTKHIGQYFFNTWLKRYERQLSIGALLFGFIFDSLTLTRIDFLYENVVMVGYLSLAAATIVISALALRGTLKGKLFTRVGILSPFVLQYAFGGLFSAFFIFFSRSASFFASWPFMLLLLAIMIGNEVLRERYQRFSFQMLVWYIALYLYIVLIVPVLVRQIGFLVFISSGVIALLIVFALISVLKRLTPSLMSELARTPYRVMIICFVVMNALYLFNIIPPFPLALKEAGPYEFVARRANGEYIQERTDMPWYIDWFFRDRIEVAPGGSAYFFTSVFLPSKLTVTVVHRWQHFDEDDGEWVDVSRISFSLIGGRDEGYRGYTKLQSVVPGLWRVRVETTRGQLLGRNTFRVVSP